MAYWLFKSEPSTWSWTNQKDAGPKGTEWDGVRNYQARNNMRLMNIGDLGFFYHSVHEKCIVGIVEVIAQAHSDSTDDTGKWECVDLAYHSDIPNPISLDQVKQEPVLNEMILVNNSRLSVQPVSPKEWTDVCRMTGLAKAPISKASEGK